MFQTIKLFFTDRDYYKQLKRYKKLQKAVRKELKKQAKEFCPWSGYYFHKMVVTMLEFYHKIYLSGDCCWSERTRIDKITKSLADILKLAEDLDNLDNLEDSEMFEIASKDKAFAKYVAAWEKEVDINLEESSKKETLLGGLADSYLNDKYTKAMYKAIGEHLWDWCD